jgi:hypothetical protein
MTNKEKSESLAKKMNELTAKFSDNLDTADELVLTGSDVEEYVEEQTSLQPINQLSAAEIINLENMVSDFKFVRETLRENAENGRRVLNKVTLDLLGQKDNKRQASLITSFAELNKAVADNMKLYVISYKEISKVLVNLDRISKKDPKTVNNTLNIKGEAVNTLDLIKELSNKKE